MYCPQVPYFWLVKYKFTTSFQDIKKIQQSFLDLGFGILAYTDEICYIKLYHYKPKYMTLWTLRHQDLIYQYRLKISPYTHNTRTQKISTVELEV